MTKDDEVEDFSELFFFSYMAVLGGLLLAWFNLTGRLFSYLAKNHPNEYEAMGRPHLLLNNTPRNTIAFLKFALGNRPLELKDDRLVQKCQLLKRYLYVFESGNGVR